jgi:hypothetical protein
MLPVTQAPDLRALIRQAGFRQRDIAEILNMTEASAIKPPRRQPRHPAGP